MPWWFECDSPCDELFHLEPDYFFDPDNGVREDCLPDLIETVE